MFTFVYNDPKEIDVNGNVEQTTSVSTKITDCTIEQFEKKIREWVADGFDVNVSVKLKEAK